MMNEADRRQLKAMRHQIDAFRQRRIDIAWLISSLESLRHALQMVPESWIEAFWSRWGLLEQIYSLSVVREEPIPPKDAAEIERALDEMDHMVLELLSEAED